MATKIQKWGNSLAVRIPKEVAEGFRSGVSVDLRREGDAEKLSRKTGKFYKKRKLFKLRVYIYKL
jgi:antitoxin component of MazEF toxin-antitoxin module